MKICIATIIISLISLSGFSGDFTYLRSWEGLPDGEINAIVQDSSGSIWMATWSGLIKYDGYRYVVYRPDMDKKGSLLDKKIKDLLVDSENNLWVVTSKYLFLYNREQNTFSEIVFDNELSGNINIVQITEVGKSIFINAASGLFGLPLKELDTKSYSFKKITVTEKGEKLNEFYYRISGYNSNIILYRQYSGEPTSLTYAKPNYSDGKLEVQVFGKDVLNTTVNSAVYVPTFDRLFYGTSQGLISVQGSDLKGSKEIYFENQVIRKLFFASNHFLYVAVAGPALNYIDLQTGIQGSYKANPNIAGTLINNNILSVYEDFSGNLWIGHQGQGVSILNLNRKSFKTFRKDPSEKFSLNSNIIMCFEKSAKELFVGCRTGGLNIAAINTLSNQNPIFQTIKWPDGASFANSDNQIWDIERQTDSLFWVGTDRGLFKLEKTGKGWQLNPFPGNPQTFDLVRKIEIDRYGNLWCGGFSSGLIFIPDPRKNKTGINYRFTSQPDDSTTISDNNIISFLIDGKQRMWVGTQNGLNLLATDYEQLDLSGNVAPVLKFRRFIASENKVNNLNNNEINDIVENPDGKIWVMTQGGGINIYDLERNHWEHLTINSGLPSNDVIGCLSDDEGNFWISTSRGLVRLKKEKDNYDITRFDVKDGIQGDIFMVNSFYKATDGQLFFGGDNGFTCFYPSEIVINPVAPRVILTNLEIEEKIYDAGDMINENFVLEKALDYTNGIVLPFKYNSFRIGVSSIHFQDPSKNKISYYLEGYNKSWHTIPAQNQFVEFVKLPFGKYILHVKAISADNLESEVKTVAIEIKPPWYLRWYSVILFLLMAMSLVIGFIFLMIHRQKLIYQRKLADLSARNNENKMQFLTNIAHDLRTPLSLIIAPVMDLKRNFTGNNQILDSHLNIISRNSNYLLRLINQIIDFQQSDAGKLTLHPENTNFTGLIKDIVLNFHGLESRNNVHIVVNTPDEPVFVETDIQKVEEILYNLLSNAFKFTPAGETIEITLERISDNNGSNANAGIRLSVFNHGPEIEEEHLTLIFDRFFKVDEQAEGSGIGLSYTKSLVELLRGKIRAESVKGKGVVFIVELPFEYKDLKLSKTVFEESKIEKQSIPLFNNTEELSGGIKRKVVIIEDNKELLDYLKNLFSRKYICFTALNGAEGLGIIVREKPSVIITDAVMPVMGGLALIKEIKENLEICHIPIILLTANNSDEARRTGYELGADAYISKPFDNELLLAQAERLIKNRELIRDKYKSQNFMVEVDSNSSKDNDFVQNVKNLFEAHLTNPEFNVNQLSQLLNISTTQLYRRLKQLTGHTPVEFIRLIRLQKAHSLLGSGKNTVKEVCYLTGFNNLSYFIKCFKEQFGVTPASFRDSGQHDESE